MALYTLAGSHCNASTLLSVPILFFFQAADKNEIHDASAPSKGRLDNYGFNPISKLINQSSDLMKKMKSELFWCLLLWNREEKYNFPSHSHQLKKSRSTRNFWLENFWPWPTSFQGRSRLAFIRNERVYPFPAQTSKLVDGIFRLLQARRWLDKNYGRIRGSQSARNPTSGSKG